MVTENLKLFKLDAKCHQVRIHNVFSLGDMHDTQFVQIQIQLPNWKSSPEASSSGNPCLENFNMYL